MREIKFKAWDEERKMMYYGDEIESRDDLIAALSYGQLVIFRVTDGEYTELKPLQYTELQDRNGKDIYEGDILHVKESLSNFVYNQTNGTCTSNSWENNFKDVVKFSPSGLQLVSYYANQHECEVLGDIHTNPDLLGEVRE